jgi:GTP-binding protein Era
MDEGMGQNNGEFRSGFVLLWGRPNVGKSTLLNAFLGIKVAIVTARPQTTRNRIAGVLTTDTAQFVFVDTPGIHTPSDLLGEYMQATAREALVDADVILFVVDASTEPRPDDRASAQLLKNAQAPILLVLNKRDLLTEEQLEAQAEAYGALGEFPEHFFVSAITQAGLPELRARVEALLPPGPMFYPPEMVTDHPESFQVAEFIREQALLLTQQEVPYSLAVVVEEMQPRNEELTYVRAILYVERESQKGILIGEGGKMLRAIGQQARVQAEAALGKRLYLDLWVKVRPRWRRDESILSRFGYRIPKAPRRRKRR